MSEAKTLYLSKVCYSFLGLTIVCALVFIVFWSNQSNKESQFSKTPPSTKDKSTCPILSLVGDGYCDDEANIPECGYDLKDCCQVENDRSLCQNCSCILSNNERQAIEEENCKEYNFDHGDGFCDSEYNNAENFFDIGDCCLPIQDLACTQQNAVGSCPDKACIKSNNFCIPHQLGDGICQDHNNGPFCNFDLGDCCLRFSDDHNNEEFLTDCCTCSCHADGSTLDYYSIFSEYNWG